ncbi:early nodulin-like protein 2 [Cornus florida]|uniref:early nodulin-like protein 2 n=1 Tax=Cornus florida TaxID=4283 RepID=UPI00289F87AB|nr:early nodulin-like protein 2 [Cornus florida]
MRYLRGTSHLRLGLGNGQPLLVGYTDADMTGDVDTRKSTSGYLITFAATISDTIPSTVAIDSVVSTPATNPSASPQITTAPAAAGGARDKERGKRPHPDSGVDPEEEPLIRRTWVSGPSALLHRPVRAPAPSGPVVAGASASASASPSLPTLPPWAPRITTAPPTALPLTAPQSSTVVPPITTADGSPQQNDSVIHLDSPPREGEMADGTEEAGRHNQEAVGTEAAS